ncbi:unnamed protein product [Rotaria magnacalcarata]|uniref:Uncharacterized protein n=1 Tax=Rotaria magnacalcarata TaxID=392030 RepID=A0A816VS46_9BILA|nr:unnamed protein product [Rotaria magnacalcarata]CAF2273091.1 unnamed protein product [Rotaria magnacalcarata]CAF3759629.1 unnamed protein product [Rotaria magnacalcarata]CAF3815379.1 unnamed protein product [Rotaria magnacalcarata]
MPQHTQKYYRKQQNFNDRFPLSVVAILAVIQMLTTFSIIGLEIGHIVYNVRLTNLFVGFWASLPFTILWISTFANVCCCRRRSCATHTLVENCISFIFAFILIGINAAFLRRPDACFFTERVCANLYRLNYDVENFGCVLDDKSPHCRNVRLTLIKAQLASGVIMAVTCFLYFILYGITTVKASRSTRHQAPTVTNAVMTPVYQHRVQPTMPYPYQHLTSSPYSYRPSVPLGVPGYQQTPAQFPLGITNMNYLPPHQEPNLYPKISNDRF